MYLFGIVFIVSTTLVLFFKKEKDDQNTSESEKQPLNKKDISLEENLTVSQTYKLMWKILWLGPIQKMILILMTVKVNIVIKFP